MINVAGGEATPLTDIVVQAQHITGLTIATTTTGEQAGDVLATNADISAAAGLLGWTPTTSLAKGLTAQWEWMNTHQLSPAAH